MTKRFYILLFTVALQLPLFTAAAVEPLTLDSCLEMARRNNPAVRKAELSVRKAEEVKAQALTKYFPQVQASAFGFHALHPLVDVGIDDIGDASVRDLLTTLYGNFGEALGLQNSLNLFQHGYLVGVTAVQPVFVGGKIVAGNKLAKVGVEAAKLHAEIEERDQLEQAEESYWLVYGLQQKQQIIDEAVQLIDTLYIYINAAVDAGLALPSDLTQVTIRRNEIERKQLQLQSGLRLAKRALALAIGYENSDSLIILTDETCLTSDNHTLRQQTISPTPEHQLLALQVRAAELERRMVLADALPQLAVGANYSYSQWQANILRDGLYSKAGNGALFVTLQVPLSNWWETGHKLREKNYALQQAQLDAEYLGQQLDLRTQQAFDQVAEAQAMLLLQEKAAQHAEEAYSQTLANYEAGRATIIDLLQAQMNKTQAQTDLSDAQIACKIHLRHYYDLIR